MRLVPSPSRGPRSAALGGCRAPAGKETRRLREAAGVPRRAPPGSGDGRTQRGRREEDAAPAAPSSARSAGLRAHSQDAGDTFVS